MRKLFKKTQSAWEPEKLPRHIAIVMDGNGRWAKKRSLPRTAGHAAGAETFRRIATYCKNIGIEYLTVYAFSTENWKRPPEEVEKIMQLLEKYIIEALGKMERDKVKMKFLGDVTVLSPKLKELVAEAEELSKTFDGVQVNVCLNYGSRDEIIRAVKSYAAEQIIESNANTESTKKMEETIGSLTEEKFSKYLYTADIPDPDLIIRPSGEHRVSNFLLWQSAYSEYYFTDALWPDFNEKELDKAIIAYQSRERRYGAI
ncbi:MAG: isoprenyl transferase [Oscillospiraceae bacterium]|nr:isoprenyl transferase [Oscillospiraceae bacterium]